MNFFNLFPAGQGLFYAGLLNDGDYSFVYDCGSESNRRTLSTYINELKRWNGNDKLDFVAISHFHNDHINGIKELHDKIGFEELFMPYVCSDAEIRCLYIAGSYVESLPENEIGNDAYRDNLNFVIEKASEIDEEHSKDFVLSTQDWIFNFFQKTIDNAKLSELKRKLDEYKEINGYSNIIDVIKNGEICDIKDIYRNVFGNNLNKYSLVLLHYPIAPNTFRRTYFYPNQYALVRYLRAYPLSRYYSEGFYPYTLLTGDAEFDSDISSRILASFPTGVSGIIQVPHHGSQNNWDLFKKYFASWNAFNVYVVPFGTRNHYGHPCSLIASDVTPIKYYNVTEYSGFPYWIN